MGLTLFVIFWVVFAIAYWLRDPSLDQEKLKRWNGGVTENPFEKPQCGLQFDQITITVGLRLLQKCLQSDIHGAYCT